VFFRRDEMSWSDDTFTRVFERVHPGLCRYLEGMLGGSGAAQEIAQEAMLRLYRLGPSAVAPGEERFWLYRVATNLAFNELRRATVRSRLAGAVAALVGRRDADPYERAETAERDRRLEAALARLPAAQRAAVLLRERDELAYAEIAHVLGVSLAKVKTDIFRARASLRADLAGPGDGARATAPSLSRRRP
jgi:RNA polymerase sigma factor (sigma-70 family)